MQKNIILLLISLLLFSCGGDKKPEDEGGGEVKKAQVEPQAVEVQVLRRSDFNRQLFSNGTLHSARKAGLRFGTNGVLLKINAANGQKVNTGQIIASLKNKKQKLSLEEAEGRLEAASIELSSEIIVHGGKAGDTTSVSPAILKNLKIQSGYNSALTGLKQARLDYENTFLKAPFTGVVSGIKAQTFDMISSSDVFCNLLDNSQYVVLFTILEPEINSVRKGMDVTVIPFAGDTVKLKGVITEINPEVDENGLITVKATLPGSKTHETGLYDGMNVRVAVENKIANQLVIPKEALVLRSNRKVVFTYEKGLAKWNYVKTSFENSTQYVVTEGLNPGDTVIVKGNLNLAHDAKVKIAK